MKEFISGLATLLLISVLLVQATSNQVINNKLIFAENDINTFIEEIKYDGYITEENKDELKAKLVVDLKLDSDAEIVITGTDSISERKLRGELIEYSIQYPLEDIVGAGGLLGITDDENRVVRTRAGKTASEYVAWE